MNSRRRAFLSGYCGRIFHLQIIDIDIADKTSILQGTDGQDGNGLLSCKRYQAIIVSF